MALHVITGEVDVLVAKSCCHQALHPSQKPRFAMKFSVYLEVTMGELSARPMLYDVPHYKSHDLLVFFVQVFPRAVSFVHG